jgi:hypothetical protein
MFSGFKISFFNLNEIQSYQFDLKTALALGMEAVSRAFLSVDIADSPTRLFLAGNAQIIFIL